MIFLVNFNQNQFMKSINALKSIKDSGIQIFLKTRVSIIKFFMQFDKFNHQLRVYLWFIHLKIILLIKKLFGIKPDLFKIV